VVGFTAGVRYVNPDCEVLEAVVGDFNDPGKAKEIALSMYNRGADFIQPIAGASGMGVFNAAKEADRYAFGVGGNQNYMEPDYIVATALRDVNTIVYNEIKALVEGTWEPGVHISGIKEGSVGFDNTQSNIELPEDIAKAVEDIKAKIVSGELVPCESAEELESWLAENQYQPAE
jgi:basic membrane protein A